MSDDRVEQLAGVVASLVQQVNRLTARLDVLEAVETQTALYSATTGRNGGANIQMITRLGTNEFDGRCLTSFRMRSSTLTTSF